METRSVPPISAPVIWDRDRFLSFAAEALDATPDEISADENLISLGLASVSLMRLRTQLLQDGFDIGRAALAEAGCISGWEALLAQADVLQIEARPVAALEDGSPFPLTHVQRAYWLGRSAHIELGGVAAHGYLEMACEDLDETQLENALNRVIAAHPMLRAVITDAGEQRILEDVPQYRIACEDWRDDTIEQAEQKCAATRDRMRQQILPFDVWPMFEIRLSRMPQDKWIMHLSFDILLFDIKSLELWVGEWWKAYSDPLFEVPSPVGSFRDHVMRITKREKSEQAQRAREYWQTRIPNLPLGPDLPLKTLQEAISGARFRRVQTQLTRAQWTAISAHAQKYGLTGSAFMMALYARALAVWSTNPLFSLTVTLFSRDSIGQDMDDVIGDFTSLLPLEIDCRAHDTMAELSKAAQQRLWHDLDNSMHSGIEVLAALQAREGTHGKALIPYVFTSGLGTGRSYIDAFSAFGRIVDAAVQTPQLLIDHQVLEYDGGIVVNWDYVADAFEEKQIEEIAKTHVDWLRKLADQTAWEDPTLFASAPAASEPTQEATWDPALANRSLSDVFEQTVAQYPARKALISGDRTISYAALDNASTSLANTLVSHGVQAEELVGIHMRKGWQQVVAVLAILKAGGAYMPIDPTLPNSRARTLAQVGRLRVVLQSNDDDGFGDIVTAIAVDESWLDMEPQSPPAIKLRPDRLAYVLFTSGSTGVPKGVMIEHRAALNTVLAVNQRNNIGPDDRFMMISALHFDLSVYDIFGAFAAGACLVIPEDETLPDPLRWEHLIQEHGVTIWNSVPALLSLFVDHLEDRGLLGHLALLKQIFLSGDWLPVSLCQRVRKLAPQTRLVSMGGPTEAAIWQVDFPITQIDPNWRSIPYGRPLANHHVRILDHALRPRPVGVVGEVFVGGAGLARGYWDQPEHTEAAFITDPTTGERLYRSGDWARWHPDGWIEFLGRTDTQVKVNGVRIELGEIENTIVAHPDIARAATIIVDDATGGKQLRTFYTTEVGRPVNELHQWIAGRLPRAYVPTTLSHLDQLPLTGNGKVDRRALQNTALETTAQPPRRKSSEAEIAVLSIWSDLLGFSVTDPNSNFFVIGGTSLLATRLAMRLSHEFDQDFSAVRVFEFSTAAGQAKQLATDAPQQAGGTNDSLIEIRKSARNSLANRRRSAGRMKAT